MLVVRGAVMAVFQLAAVGRLARRFSASTQVAAGFALTGVATAALAIARSYPVVLSAVGVLALGTAVVTPNPPVGGVRLMHACESETHLGAEFVADAVACEPGSGTASQSGVFVGGVGFETDDHDPVAWERSERRVAAAREVGSVDDHEVRRVY